MMRVLLLLVSSQVIYTWTDASGTHYTDDPSTAPKGAKLKRTEGEELSTLTTEPTTRDAGVSLMAQKPKGPDTCAAAVAQVATAERAVSDAANVPEPGSKCFQQLSPGGRYGAGQVGYARCMADREAETTANRQRAERAAASLEAAREALRMAQISGCH